MPHPPLIGHAGSLLDLLTVTQPKSPRVKLLFGGAPGIGKTEVSRRLALQICEGKWGVQEIIGRKCSVHHIYRYEEEFGTSCLYGSGWKIVLINEVDTMPKDAADALLALMDELPEQRGVIATTNLPFGELPERVRSRFQRFDVRAPEEHEIAGLLEYQEALPPNIAKHIAALAGGNVREAIMSADAWKNEHSEEARALIPVQQSLASLGI